MPPSLEQALGPGRLLELELLLPREPRELRVLVQVSPSLEQLPGPALVLLESREPELQGPEQ